MNVSYFCGLCLLVWALFSPLSAQDKEDKIGTVDMQKLVNGYFKTERVREEFRAYAEEIQTANQSRLEAIKSLIEEAQKLQKQGEDPSLSREKKNELFKKAGAKNQEAQIFGKDRQEWLTRKQSALREKMNLEFNTLRSEIIVAIQKSGDENGYDFIFDRSGSSGAQVPILSYAKDAIDLTGSFLELINKDAPDSAEGEAK